jgi:hypothetical protein
MHNFRRALSHCRIQVSLYRLEFAMIVNHPFTGTRAFAALAALALLSSGQAANAQTILPPDVKDTCTVTRTEFAGWFLSHGIEKDGIVNPADSLSFAPDSLCSFYKWSEQMFLWLVSPIPAEFHLGTHIFNSATFYTVSPLTDGKRDLIRHDPNKLLNFAPTISQLGSRRQEVVFDSTGKIHDVVRPETGPSSRLLLRDRSDQPVEIARIAAAANGKPLLLDKTDKEIDVPTAANGAPLLRDAAGSAIPLQDSTVVVNGERRLVTTSGAVVEFGQALSNAALMTQKGQLVYYLLQVNDVFAYFRTGVANGKFNPAPSQFPTDAATLKQITDFAAQALPPNTLAKIDDANALAVEVKSAWIETKNLANPGDYVTVTATIPDFVANADNTQLVQSPTPRQAQLALVGVHVVGSTAKHPEMVWATFEHINNTPNIAYTYASTSDPKTPRPADGAGNWLFSATGAASTNPGPRMRVDRQNPANIKAVGSGTIGPSNITRLKPWGTAADDAQFTANNTDVISINKSVGSFLLPGDVRKNYIMIGATWTKGGQPPTDDNQVGTNAMANSTMETFTQDGNCFGCHSSDDMLGSAAGGGLSHIWGPIKSLFP